MSRLINDVDTLNSFFANTFRRVFSSSASVAATLIGMLLLDWRLALALREIDDQGKVPGARVPVLEDYREDLLTIARRRVATVRG